MNKGLSLDIQEIRDSIKNGSFKVSDHAFDEMENDGLDLENIVHSVNNGEIIEDYPNSRISPSCLIYGNDYEKKPVHSVWGYIKERLFSALIPHSIDLFIKIIIKI